MHQALVQSRKSRFRVIAMALVASLSFFVSGCSSQHMAEAGQAVIDAASDGRFDVDALLFAQNMIPHHQQALELADLAAANSTNPDVLAIAEEIRAAQDPEIAQMKAWLDEVGLTAATDHLAHMDGMLSDAQMAALAAARGADFDRLFLEGMIEHHRGAISMAEQVLTNANADVSALAEQIVASQTSEITAMEGLLAALGQ